MGPGLRPQGPFHHAWRYRAGLNTVGTTNGNLDLAFPLIPPSGKGFGDLAGGQLLAAFIQDYLDFPGRGFS